MTKPTGRPRGRPRKYAPGEERPKPKKRKTRPRGTGKLPPTKKGAALPRWWRPFMKELEENGGFKELAKQTVGISGRTPESYLQDHPEIRERWDEETELAIERAKERILAEGIRRGVKGYEEQLSYQGEPTGMVTRYSDTLLIFSANAKGIGTQVPAQVNFNFDAKALDELPEDLLERLAKGESPAQIVAEWRTRQAEKKG